MKHNLDSIIRSFVEEVMHESVIKNHKFFQLLREAGDDEFEQGEQAALDMYNKAQSALTAWEENARKKQAFDAEFKKLRSQGVSQDKARKMLKQDPKFSYSVPLAAKKRNTLEQELKKAEARYAAYNPEIRDYQREKKGGARSLANKQMPTAGKKVFMDITKTPFLKWVEWPAAIKKSKLAYGSKAAGDGEQADVGTGPGEEWLAYLFGGQVQGGGVSYDVVTPDGNAWEVKQLLTKSETIRPGTEGLKAFEGARERLVTIIKQLKDFVRTARKLKLQQRLDITSQKRLSYIESFVDEQYEMIVDKGEISKERFVDLRSTLITVQNLKQNIDPIPDKPQKKKTTVGLNNKKIPVDKATFIDVAKRVEKSTGRDDILNNIEELDIALATLTDDAFSNPKKFFNDWFNSIKIDAVFSQVDGVIIVNPKGFLIIPRDQLQSSMKFEKVTQGKPRFALTIFGDGPKKGSGSMKPKPASKSAPLKKATTRKK